MQIEIEGIGQQLFSVSTWKKENRIFTYYAEERGDHPWCCWDEIESPIEYLGMYGDHCFSYAKTENEAIINYCETEGIKIHPLIKLK